MVPATVIIVGTRLLDWSIGKHYVFSDSHRSPRLILGVNIQTILPTLLGMIKRLSYITNRPVHKKNHRWHLF